MSSNTNGRGGGPSAMDDEGASAADKLVHLPRTGGGVSSSRDGRNVRHGWHGAFAMEKSQRPPQTRCEGISPYKGRGWRKPPYSATAMVALES